MANLGFRAHDFGSFDTPLELAKEINNILSPAYIQLAISKVFNNFNSYCDLSDNQAIKIKEDLDSFNIKTAIVGCYINPIHPNEELRKLEWSKFKCALEKAQYLGCPYVGTETGYVNLNDEYDISTFEKKNLDIFYTFLDKMLTVAQKNKAIIAIEPVANKHTICTLERTINMLNKFKCDNLKIIYDSVNLMDKTAIKEKDGSVQKIPSFSAQKKFHDLILDELAKDIIALHIKDFSVDNNGNKIGDLPIGTGVMDYKALFTSLNNHNVKAPRLLEMVSIKELEQTITFLSNLDEVS